MDVFLATSPHKDSAPPIPTPPPVLIWGRQPSPASRIIQLFQKNGVTGTLSEMQNSAELLIALAKEANLSPFDVNYTDEGIGIRMRLASDKAFQAMQTFLDQRFEMPDAPLLDGGSRSFGLTTRTIEVRFSAQRVLSIKRCIQSYFPLEKQELYELALAIIGLVDDLAKDSDNQIELYFDGPRLELEITTNAPNLPLLQKKVEGLNLPMQAAYEQTDEGIIVYFCSPSDQKLIELAT